MLTEMFCAYDDFCLSFDRELAARALPPRRHAGGRPPEMWMSEVMTILTLFHESRMRDFKHFYLDVVCQQMRGAFPSLVSYPRFVTLTSRAVVYLVAFALRHGVGRCTGVSFVDSTKLPVCDLRRASRHRVFAGLAAMGKTGAGWFFGFKLHLAISDQGELLGMALTPGNVDDRNRSVIQKLTARLFGKLAGDKGYIDQKLFWELYERNLELITTIRKNMKNKLMLIENRAVYRARGIIETVNGVLKEGLHIQHTRHRSPMNFISNLFAGLCAYSFRPQKPTATVQGLA